jgi:hypothetical protein
LLTNKKAANTPAPKAFLISKNCIGTHGDVGRPSILPRA